MNHIENAVTSSTPPSKSMKRLSPVAFVLLWLTLASGAAGLLLSSNHAQAHRLANPRVVHIVIHGDTMELYINFLMPKTPKSLFWIRMFDRNRDGRLMPMEQKALGDYLGARYFRGIRVQTDQRQSWFKLKEARNSTLRGNAFKGGYCWDFRFTAKGIGLKYGKNNITVTIPQLYPRENIPVAFTSADRDRIAVTKTSKLVFRKKRLYAVCTIKTGTKSCLFTLIRPRPGKKKPTSQKAKSK